MQGSGPKRAPARAQPSTGAKGAPETRGSRARQGRSSAAAKAELSKAAAARTDPAKLTTAKAGAANDRANRPPAARPPASPAPEAATPTREVNRVLNTLGLDPKVRRELYAQVARALESGTRGAKRKGVAYRKARSLAVKAPAADLQPIQLVALVLAVRDGLKGTGRGTRARAERLERASDAALRALAQKAQRMGVAEFAVTDDSARAAAPAREMLQRLVALMPNAVVTLLASGALGLWSLAAVRMLGHRREDVRRRGVAAIFRDALVWEGLLEELESRGRVPGREVTLVNADGEDVPVRIYGVRLKHVAPLPSAPRGRGQARSPDPDRLVLLFHDLSEVHHIRRRLIETEKLSAMAKIAGSVAHEFRNPLNSLFLSTDLLEDELEGRDEVRESIAPTLAAIREEIERLNQIITHYLSLSKISGASPEVMDLQEIAEAFVEENAPRLKERDVELRIRSDGADHRIVADPNQVRRILVNLVENAVDAVTLADLVEEARTRSGTVTLYIRRMRRSVKLTVKDNGPGIPHDIRERVFEPFFTSKAGGSGLGLYLVREIVLASGGSMTLSSTTVKGTSVSVRWPCVGDDASEKASS